MPDLQSFNKLINNPKFSDVVLIADDDSKFYAHCNIITLNSSYFESALQSHWKHSHTEDDRIKLKPGINSETIKIILDDLYTFSTKGISQGNIGAVFMAADFLGIEPLVALQTGDVDLVLTDSAGGKALVAASGGKLKLVGDELQAEDFGFIFPKGSDLVAPINAGIAALKAEGTLDKITQKWFVDYKPAQ